MSNELTLNCSLEYEDADGMTLSSEIVALLRTLTTDKAVKFKQSVGTSEEALVLGDIATRAWCLLINRDSTNYIEVKTGTSGTVFAKLLAGEFCFLRLGSGAQSPYVTANTASCELEGIICDL